MAQLVLSVFLIAPYIQFHDEQIKNLAASKETPKILYVNSVTNAISSTILQGIQTSNLTVSADYSTKISNNYGDTNKPLFEIYVNDFTNPIVPYASIHLNKERGINFRLKNIGTITSKNLQFFLYVPLDPTNVTCNGWQYGGHTINQATMEESKLFNEYFEIGGWNFVPPGTIAVTWPFRISQNLHTLIFSRRTLEQSGYDFDGVLSNQPLDTPFTFNQSGNSFPAIIEISSDNSTKQRILFICVVE